MTHSPRSRPAPRKRSAPRKRRMDLTDQFDVFDEEETPNAAQLVWFDPGITTGICVAALDPEWLTGSRRYAPGWTGLAAALQFVSHLQVGRHGQERGELAACFEATLRRKDSYPDHTIIEMCNVVECVGVLADWPQAAWGYEGFEVRMISADPEFLSPARIGLALTMQSAPEHDPFVQSPSLAKNTVSDERLQQAAMYQRGMRHANDAARHCATFFRRARTDAALRRAAWPSLFGSVEAGE